MTFVDYLRGGGNLAELNIKTITKDDLTLYSYGYGPPNEITNTCRSIVLNGDRIISRNFDRFFTCHDEFNWNNFIAEEKVDGSFISLFWHKEWQVHTRFGWGDNTHNSAKLTFAELFWRNFSANIDRLVHNRVSLSFELVGPINKVVNKYPEGLYLIGGWDNHYAVEYTPHQLDELANKMGVKRPFRHRLKSRQEVYDLLNSYCETNPTFEGFVINDGKNRMKLKSQAYYEANQFKFEFGKKAIAEAYFQGELDGLSLSFPEYKDTIKEYKNKIEGLLSKVESIYNTVEATTQKEFVGKISHFNELCTLLLLRRRYK